MTFRINKKWMPVSILLTFFGICMISCSDATKSNDDNENAESGHEDVYDLAAYVWPSCHHDERLGDFIWPEGTGEWEVIKKGNPRFEGHYQPKVPLWGYEMDDDPRVMERWIDAATEHGINTFIFDWYWLENGPFLESSLNNGFLKAKNNEEIKFYVMWANHDMPPKLINVHNFPDYQSSRMEGEVDLENFKIIVDRVINRYFTRHNYYRIDGKPVFSLFIIENFINGLGGMEQAREAIDYFRDQTVQAGFPGLHLQQIVFDTPTEEILGMIEGIGVNSVTMYNWDSPHPQDYIRWGVEGMDRIRQWDEALPVPFFPNVSIGWDDSPRFPAKEKDRIVHLNKSPEAFGSFLRLALDYCDEHPEQPKLITIFAWNEWIEGSYLLPDIKYGYSYLETVRKVLSGEQLPIPRKK